MGYAKGKKDGECKDNQDLLLHFLPDDSRSIDHASMSKKYIPLTTPSMNLWAIEPVFDTCEMAVLALFQHFTRYWFMLDPQKRR